MFIEQRVVHYNDSNTLFVGNKDVPKVLKYLKETNQLHLAKLILPLKEYSVNSKGRGPILFPTDRKWFKFKFRRLFSTMVAGLPNSLGYFQSPATSVMDSIIDLHNDIMVFMFFIGTFVLYMLIASLYSVRQRQEISTIAHNTFGEIV